MSKKRGRTPGKQKDQQVEENRIKVPMIIGTIFVIIIVIISFFYLNTNKNILVDPGFETGSPSWDYVKYSTSWEPYTISETTSHSGGKAALLSLRGDVTSQDTKVVGVFQEVNPPNMPKKISGHYYVNNWVRGAELQYIQCAFMAWDVPGHEDAPIQIRYIIAGIDAEPFYLDNAKFIFISRSDPGVHYWIDFERNLQDDFLNAWGFIPKGYSQIRIVFEVRFDGIPYADCSADVYFDDLYLGN